MLVNQELDMHGYISGLYRNGSGGGGTTTDVIMWVGMGVGTLLIYNTSW
jgi:hypothetical protein